MVRRAIDAPTQVLAADNSSGTAVNGMGQSTINSGFASDGAGSGFNVPMVLWLSFGLAIGLFFTLGGMRLWRITTALAIGLVLTLGGQSSPLPFGYSWLLGWRD